MSFTNHACFAAFFGSSIQSNQHRKCPGPRGIDHLDAQCHYNPLVSPAIDQMLMTRPNGITVTALALNVVAAVLADRTIADQLQNTLGSKTFYQHESQPFRQRMTRPAAMRKHAMTRTEIVQGSAS